MSLPIREIGSFTTSSIGYGAMGLSANYGFAPDKKRAGRILNEALDLGVTLLDTAAVYGDGDNERLIGEAVMHRRGNFILASKGVLQTVDGKRVLDGSPAAISRSLDASLRRLRTDVIDLYYLHRLDKRVPIEDSVGALGRAIESGKIRAIGLSEMSAPTLRRAHAIYPIAAIQSEYSPIVRNPEIAVIAACRELGVGFVAFSPTARGLLSGRIASDDYPEGDIRRAMPRFLGAHLRHNLEVAEPFFDLAKTLGLTPAQLALAWVLSRYERLVPLFGTTSLRHLEENVASAAVTLSPSTVVEIERMFDGTIAGARYSSMLQAQIDTETFPDEELA